MSEISLGTAEIGMAYGIGAADDRQPCSPETCEKLLNYALDLGINHIDTARAYGNSEALIGRALRSRKNQFILTTKVLVPEDSRSSDRTLRESMFKSVETSLNLLQMTSVDILMLHSASAQTLQRMPVIETLMEIREQGYCQYVGASVYGNDSAITAIQSGIFDCLQVAYNILDRRPELGVFSAATHADIGIIARSVLLKGALTRRHRYLPFCLAPIATAARRMETIAPSLPHLAYRYVLNQVPPHTALVGTTHLSELEDIVANATDQGIDDHLVSNIRAEPPLDDEMLNPANWPPH